MSPTIVLTWRRFEQFSKARLAFAKRSCLYLQADAEGRPLRVGIARKGLGARYNDGYAATLDAAMHGSGNHIHAAAAPATRCVAIEVAILLRAGDQAFAYNKRRPRADGGSKLGVIHKGAVPAFATA